MATSIQKANGPGTASIATCIKSRLENSRTFCLLVMLYFWSLSSVLEGGSFLYSFGGKLSFGFKVVGLGLNFEVSKLYFIQEVND